MKIQLISENHARLSSFDNMCDVKDLSNPSSLDNYDINILDLSNNKMWINCFGVSSRVYLDLENISNMIKNSNSLIVIVIPQNITVGSQYTEAKNYLTNIYKLISNLLNVDPSYKIFYENSNVELLDDNCIATFAFESDTYESLLYSKTKKSVAIKKDNIIITSTKIIDDSNISLLEKFLRVTNCFSDSEEIPEWIYKYAFFNDNELNTYINNSKDIIKCEKEKINKYQEQLNNNLNYKKVLYCSGDELVQAVFKILEDIFDISLSDFKDMKREDFLFEKNGYTYIGEIKGVNSNVKNEFIYQLGVHVSKYTEEIQSNDNSIIIKPLLIINYERNREVNDRNEIHESQIDLSKKLGFIIIDTRTLLHIYSDILEEKISKEKAIEIIINSKGVLKY